MRFDKKILGRVAKDPAYCNEKIFAEFFCFVVEKILPLPGHSGALRL